MKIIYITEMIYLIPITGGWQFDKLHTGRSQEFQTKESAIYHLCTNQIIWS